MKTKKFTWSDFEEIENIVCTMDTWHKFILEPKTKDEFHSYELYYSNYTKTFTIRKSQGFNSEIIAESPYMMDITEAAMDLNLVPVGIEHVVNY
jgi:hypothetical protein